MRTDRVGLTVTPDPSIDYDPGMDAKTIPGGECSVPASLSACHMAQLITDRPFGHDPLCPTMQ